MFTTSKAKEYKIILNNNLQNILFEIFSNNKFVK